MNYAIRIVQTLVYAYVMLNIAANALEPTRPIWVAVFSIQLGVFIGFDMNMKDLQHRRRRRAQP